MLYHLSYKSEHPDKDKTLEILEDFSELPDSRKLPMILAEPWEKEVGEAGIKKGIEKRIRR